MSKYTQPQLQVSCTRGVGPTALHINSHTCWCTRSFTWLTHFGYNVPPGGWRHLSTVDLFRDTEMVQCGAFVQVGHYMTLTAVLHIVGVSESSHSTPCEECQVTEVSNTQSTESPVECTGSCHFYPDCVKQLAWCCSQCQLDPLYAIIELMGSTGQHKMFGQQTIFA